MKITKSQLKQIIKEELNEVETIEEDVYSAGETGYASKGEDLTIVDLAKLIMRVNHRLNDLDDRLKTFEGPSE